MGMFTKFGGKTMKRRLICLLTFAILLSCSACGAAPTPTETAAPTTLATTPATAAPETEPPTTLPPETEAPTEPEGSLSFNTYDITFHAPGESWEVYDGSLPKDAVIFSTDSEAVATFEDGIVTAVGNGTTKIHAICNDATITCVIRNVFDTKGLSREPLLDPPAVTEVDTDFFDDAVFIGDSVTYMLANYETSHDVLGKAQFLVRGSYSAFHAVNHTMLMNFQGMSMKLPEAIAATGAKKAFFMLGTNDIGAYGIEKTMANWDTMITNIRELVPDIEIYIQSMTPVWTGGEKGGLNNTRADEFNEELKVFAEENNCIYVDIASYMKDATGGMAQKYCSDEYVHLTEAGAEVWIQVLKAFAESRK